MFEICSHKVSSILNIYQQNLDNFLAKSSKPVLDDTVTERAHTWGFGSTVGYNLTPHYRPLDSIHVIEIFKRIAAENRGVFIYLMIPPICKIGSPSCGDLENCYFSSW